MSGGQTTYSMFPAFAEPGQLADLAYNEISSFLAAEVIYPGRAVEIAADGLSVQQVQETGSTFNPVGVSVNTVSREGSGSQTMQSSITQYGIGGPQYNIGDMVPVLTRGRIYAEWKGTTQTSYGNPNCYHSSTTATDRGKFTDANTSTAGGSEVAAAGNPFRVRQALPGSGNIVLLDVNLPGAA